MDLDENHRLEDIMTHLENKLKSYSAEYIEKEEICMNICYPQYKENTSKKIVTQIPLKPKYFCSIKKIIMWQQSYVKIKKASTNMKQ